tara:strand:- start:1166 stop:1318 length:153 start_codon:yes stop_codon:yes gene_type:complete
MVIVVGLERYIEARISVPGCRRRTVGRVRAVLIEMYYSMIGKEDDDIEDD